jgi:hypothetical protein
MTRWQKLFKELDKAGVGGSEVARRLELPQTSMSDLATGRTKEPKHSVGEALLKLRDDVLGKK